MAELVWKGKYVGGALALPARSAPALQTQEVHAANGDDPSVAAPNLLVFGDKARVLPALLAPFAGGVDLVYIDPPFDTGGAFDFFASIPGAAGDAPRVSVPAYSDARGLDGWLEWFFETAILLRDLLADGASLYVHLDAHVAHYAKVLLDEVFGQGAFQREIIWRIGWISGFKSRARSWIRNHDTLLYYAKGGQPKTFQKEYIPYAAGYRRRDGAAPRGLGHPLDDVWNGSDADRMDSIQIMSFSGEKVGYPTQKNEALVSRVLRASSRPGDLVLDCFAGSGTTAAVAEKLGRRWIAGDASPVAIHVTRKRLLALPGVRPFVVQSAAVDGVSPTVSAGTLTARASMDGARVAVTLTAFVLSKEGGEAAPVDHWSQWIEGWCVDWDHRGGALHAGSSVWRGRARATLHLTAIHSYARPGPHVVLVRAFDVFGGASTTAIDVVV